MDTNSTAKVELTKEQIYFLRSRIIEYMDTVKDQAILAMNVSPPLYGALKHRLYQAELIYDQLINAPFKVHHHPRPAPCVD